MHQRLKVEGVLGFDCRHSASQMQNMPASSPSIDTAEPEDRRVDPRPEVVKKTMLVRVQKIIQKMLNYVEEK
ncbi:Protein of unknown function [Cotesia congregata]|uniref:Uncharacterized protein n=1 Tax=Cotesia congregata TaxID=51543 RepID=A0A8J2H8F9_COTCN|nr:Protein of unknown function [Cotesia congregata]